MVGYSERDRDPMRKPKPRPTAPREAYDDDEDEDYHGGPVPDPTIGVGNDLEGASISVELFNLQEAERVAKKRAMREVEVALLIRGFDHLLRLATDGSILYWERVFGRKTEENRLYRYAALFSDGLWWITGRHTSGRTHEAMITELIRHSQKPTQVTFMAAQDISRIFVEGDYDQKPLIRGYDPELERLLDEEEEIAARLQILQAEDAAEPRNPIHDQVDYEPELPVDWGEVPVDGDED